MVLVVKKLPANTGDIGDEGSIPGLGRSPREGHGNPLLYSCHLLEKGMATRSCILAWEIPWTEELDGLWPIELHRVGHD